MVLVEFMGKNNKIVAAPQDIESEIRCKINPPSNHVLRVRNPDFGLIDFHFEDVEDKSNLVVEVPLGTSETNRVPLSPLSPVTPTGLRRPMQHLTPSPQSHSAPHPCHHSWPLPHKKTSPGAFYSRITNNHHLVNQVMNNLKIDMEAGRPIWMAAYSDVCEQVGYRFSANAYNAIINALSKAYPKFLDTKDKFDVAKLQFQRFVRNRKSWGDRDIPAVSQLSHGYLLLTSFGQIHFPDWWRPPSNQKVRQCAGDRGET